MNKSLNKFPPERFLRPFFKTNGLYQGKLLHGNPKNLKQRNVSKDVFKRFYRACVCEELGKPLVVKNKESVQLSSGEIRVNVAASGINFGDLLMVLGKYQVKVPAPFTPGSEYSGTVVEVADDVTNFKPGMRVAGTVPFGAFAEQVVGNANTMWEIPDSMSFEEGASFIVSYMTAYTGLQRRAAIKPGETVLVTAAAGATGLAAIDLCSHVFKCSNVIGCCGSQEKCDFILKNGATHAINYKKNNIKESVMEISAQGADVVFEAVGGNIWKECLRSIAWEGRLLVVGFAGGEIPQIPANLLLLKNASAVGLYWGRYMAENPQLLQRLVKECISYYEDGKIKPHYSASFQLDKVNEAFQFIKSRKSTGKVVITMQ